MRDKPLRLLVVADNPDDVQLLEEAFGELDEIRFTREWLRPLRPVYCLDPAEAARTAANTKFDAALLASDLGGNAGPRAFQALREQAPHLPVVVLIPPGDEPLALNLIRQGAQDYVVKQELDCVPLARSIECAVARQHLAESRSRQALIDDFTGMWNGRGLDLLGQTIWRMAARCGFPTLLARAELITGDSNDLELLEAAESFRAALPETALLARVDRGTFVALLAPAREADFARFEQGLGGKMRLGWKLCRPDPAEGDLISLCENVGGAVCAGRHL